MSLPPTSARVYRYYDFVMAAFVTVLLTSNLIGAAKVVTVGPLTFGAGVLFFPMSYLFGDILTEVYGYARSRKVVWAGFAAMCFASVMAWVIVKLPPAASWEGQAAVEAVFGTTWRIGVGSLIAFFFGEFTNSYVMAKMKLYTQGRVLWARTIGSTIFGEAVDSLLFYPIAFLGIWPTHLVMQVMCSNYAMKVLWEVFMTPVTYQVVGFLKRAEQEDYYDYHTRFTPFTLEP
jgi:uncharacterized integral membrane protein (TIGR00697 family)